MHQYDQLAKRAEVSLSERSFDVGHDATHHFQVWVNCLDIVAAEKLEVHLGHLKVAAWWHDADRQTDNHPRFHLAAQEVSLEPQDTSTILDIMNAHSFDDERGQSVEAKVLFDADKVEYVGCVRWLRVMSAIRLGQAPLEDSLKYSEALNQRIGTVVAQITYDRTRQMLRQQLAQMEYYRTTSKFIPEIDQAIDWPRLRSAIN